jgi:two-component system, sensor histidine kinase YesM
MVEAGECDIFATSRYGERSRCTQFSASSAAFLLGEDGEPVALSTRARGPDRALLSADRMSVPPRPDSERVPWTLTSGGHRYLVDSVQVAHTAWQLILLVPYEDIDALATSVRRQMLIALAVILPFMLPLAFWVASTSTRRIARLAAGLREFERGNLALQWWDEGGEEIGELTGDLNRMASRIGWLLGERYRLGQETKNQEMRALQAQINPHFLYNTLDLVNCLGMAHRPSVARSRRSRASFACRSAEGPRPSRSPKSWSMSRSTFASRTCASMTASPSSSRSATRCGASRCSRSSYSPSSRTPLLHGIREKESGRGTVTIRARSEPAMENERRERATLAVDIVDDGVGMEPVRLSELQTGDTGGGARLRRSEHRAAPQDPLRLALRPDPFQSERGVGTRVTIRIPLEGPRQKEEIDAAEPKARAILIR